MDTIWPDGLVSAKGPKYKAVAETIRKAITTKILSEGAKLPPVRELAYKLQITPGTVARAYTILTDEGVLRAEVGRGTFVASPDSGASSPQSIVVDVVKHGSEGGDGYHVDLFSPHLPAVGQTALIRQLLSEVVQDPPSGLMHYPNRNSERPAREAAARWLSQGVIGTVRQEDVVLTNGGQNAVVMALQARLSGRRPAVLVEEMTYPGFRRAADLLRADVVPIAMDAHGMLPESLDAACRTHDAQILCTSPEVHNPTLCFTPEERRAELVAVARRHDLHILEDNCYGSSDRAAASYRLIAPERTWWVTSISKLLTPSLRIGVALAPRDLTPRLRHVSEINYFGVATPLVDLTCKLLSHPQLDEVIARMHAEVGRYVHAAVNILGGHPLEWRSGLPFLWLTLPVGWRAGAFVQAAEAQGVRIRPAEDFAVRSARSPHAVRMSVNAGVSLETFERAIQRLRTLLDNPPDKLTV